MEAYPGISIIIPTYNNEKTLEKTIPSILNQKYKGNIEVILVDDNSPDNTKDIAKKFGLKLIRHEKNMGLANSVNDGFYNASYDLVCIIHDDVLLPDDKWLSKLIPHLQDPSIAAVTSPVIMTKEIWNRLNFWEKAMYVWELGDWQKSITALNYSDGKNDIYKKEIFLKFGGFDSSTYRVACEDVDLSKRLQRAGYKILSIPIPAYHLHSPRSTGLKNILKKNAQLSEGQGVLFRKYRFIGGWNNQVFKSLAIVGLAIPIESVRILSALYIIALVMGYTLKTYIKMRDYRILFVLPIVKLVDYFINVACFWKGFLTKKQRL